MNNRRVYFWAGRHPIHESVIRYPPEGFEMFSNVDPKQFNIVREYEKGYECMKKVATIVYNLLGLPRVIWVSKPCDLIHTSSGVIPLNRKPWVVGVEHASSFVGLQEEKMQNPDFLRKVAKYLLSDYCKKILPFSEACKRSIENAYKPYIDGFAHKLEVLYPAIEPQIKVVEPRDRAPLKLLFISRHFFDDGGREVVKAFEFLARKYDVELDMVVGAPKHHLVIFKNLSASIACIRESV